MKTEKISTDVQNRNWNRKIKIPLSKTKNEIEKNIYCYPKLKTKSEKIYIVIQNQNRNRKKYIAISETKIEIRKNVFGFKP
jgi:hypothetical protein